MDAGGMASGGIVVPDFLQSDFFNGSPPGAGEWISDIEDGFGDAIWDVQCLDTGALRQDHLTAAEPGLCQVPDAGALFYEGELSAMSTEPMMTCMQLAGFDAGSHQGQVSDDGSLSPSESVQDQQEALLDSVGGSIVTCSRAAAPKLQLDYDKVLSAWEAMGGSVAASPAMSAASSVTLHLPAASISSGGGALPSYNLAAAPPGLLPPFGAHASGPAPGVVPAICAAGGDCSPLRRASLQSTSRSAPAGASQSVGDVLLGFGDGDCPPDMDLSQALLSCSFDSTGLDGTGFDGHGFEVSSLCSIGSGSVCSDMTAGASNTALTMPPIPKMRSGGLNSRALSTLCLPSLPQSLASIPAKAMECAKSARAACFVRYKEKKQNRKTGKIRYEMRKLNAEKRPRIRGRFVKREELRRMLEAEAEEVSPRSDASTFDCEPIWPYTQ